MTVRTMRSRIRDAYGAGSFCSSLDCQAIADLGTLAVIVRGPDMAAILDWFKNPDNAQVLSFSTTVIAGLWTVFVTLVLPKMREQHVSGAAARHHGNSAVREPNVSRRVLVWIIGLIILLGIILWIIFVYMQPTMIKVCRSEETPDCAAYDEFIGCGDLTAWAKTNCVKAEGHNIYSRAGGMCGHNVIMFACYKRNILR